MAKLIPLFGATNTIDLVPDQPLVFDSHGYIITFTFVAANKEVIICKKDSLMHYLNEDDPDETRYSVKHGKTIRFIFKLEPDAYPDLPCGYKISIPWDDYPDEFTCVICMSHLNKPVALGCGHLFCRDCICGWSENATSCPTCRNAFAEEETVVISPDVSHIIKKFRRKEEDCEAMVNCVCCEAPWKNPVALPCGHVMCRDCTDVAVECFKCEETVTVAQNAASFKVSKDIEKIVDCANELKRKRDEASTSA